MKRDTNWINDVKDRLDKAEVTAPEGLFADIESEMKARGLEAGRPVPAYRRLLWVPAAACVVALALVSTWHPGEKTPLEVEIPTESIAVVSPETAVQDTPVAEEPVSVLGSDTEPVPGMKILAEVLDGPSDEVPAASTVPTAESVTEPLPESKEIPEFIEDNFPYSDEPDRIGKRKIKFHAGLVCSGMTASSQKGTASMVVPFQSPTSVTGSSAGIDSYKVREHTATTDIMHSQPIKFGVTVGVGITDWLRISTGVTYSFLHSKSIMEIDNNRTETRQDLHFIGVPLNFQFRLFEIGFFSSYANLGASMEGLVSGQRKVTSSLDDKKHPGIAGLKDKCVYFSGNAGLGLNFKVAGPFNIFVEPGISYYFKNNSQLNTIYSEKPLNFNLNVGLRFDI